MTITRKPLGANLFADSLVCLDASTGQRKWHYQLVHHGLWDYDMPGPPSLVRIKVDGKRIDAVVQLTKQGFAFVFDRVTGSRFGRLKSARYQRRCARRKGMADTAVSSEASATDSARRFIR